MDTLYGGSGNDYLDGRKDTDSIYGGDGNDTLNPGSGTNDYIDGGAGIDLLQADYSNVNDPYSFSFDNIELVSFKGSNQQDNFSFYNTTDTLYGNGGDDIFHAGLQNDYIDGGTGNDTLVGEDGNDTLYGRDGNDWMYGDFDTAADGTGNDYLDGGNGSDSLIGGGGSDTLWGGDSNEFDFLVGGKGSDYLYGQAGGDYLQGGADTDYVDGGTGNDVLRGDSASLDNNLFQYDTLTGGTGADTFYLFNFSPNGGYGVSYLGAGYATITDFKYWGR
ncbi:MAG: calcium-binding protein [Hydrococcus sp. CSU_1_8]|nr:calcium-binding protein [Hydrococcus sp. CSU_1_8]